MNSSFVRPALKRWLAGHVAIAAALTISSALGLGWLWVMAIALFPRGGTVSILHYSAGLGIDFIGEGGDIMALPRIGAVVAILNGVLAAVVWPADQRAGWLLLATVPLVQVLLLTSLIFLWQVNR